MTRLPDVIVRAYCSLESTPLDTATYRGILHNMPRINIHFNREQIHESSGIACNQNINLRVRFGGNIMRCCTVSMSHPIITLQEYHDTLPCYTVLSYMGSLWCVYTVPFSLKPIQWYGKGVS